MLSCKFVLDSVPVNYKNTYCQGKNYKNLIDPYNSNNVKKFKTDNRPQLTKPKYQPTYKY